MSKEEIKDETITLVVEALPQQPIRIAEEAGKNYAFLTRDEALTEILMAVREIKRSVA
jgi:hypothetical protein